jgi:hypothetical protein
LCFRHPALLHALDGVFIEGPSFLPSMSALALNLGRHLRSGYHGPRWKRAQLRLLGKEPHDVMAAKLFQEGHIARSMSDRNGRDPARRLAAAAASQTTVGAAMLRHCL